MHVIAAVALFREMIKNPVHFCTGSIRDRRRRRPFITVRRHIRQISPYDLKGFLLIFRNPVHISGNFRMHLPAAEFFIGDGFPQCQLNHPGSGYTHGTSLYLYHEIRQARHPGRHAVAFPQDGSHHGGLAHAAHDLQISVKTAASERGQSGGSHDIRHAGAAGLTQINYRIPAMSCQLFNFTFLASRDSTRGGGQYGKIV